MTSCWEYQAEVCRVIAERSPQKILNAASNSDPALLGRTFDAVNLDILEYDPCGGVDLTRIRNYVHGSVLDIPFEDGHFDIVVLGEFLEHCKLPIADRAMQECKRVLADDGVLVITVPQDNRPLKIQMDNRPTLVYKYDEDADITSWHQTFWTDEMLEELVDRNGYTAISQKKLNYLFTEGWGMVLRKRQENGNQE